MIICRINRLMYRLHANRWLLACLLLTGLQATASSMNPVSGRPEVTLISVEQEKKIGAEEAKKVESCRNSCEAPLCLAEPAAAAC